MIIPPELVPCIIVHLGHGDIRDCGAMTGSFVRLPDTAVTSVKQVVGFGNVVTGAYDERLLSTWSRRRRYAWTIQYMQYMQKNSGVRSSDLISSV